MDGSVYKIYERVEMFIAGKKREVMACRVFYSRRAAEMCLSYLQDRRVDVKLVIEQEVP